MEVEFEAKKTGLLLKWSRANKRRSFGAYVSNDLGFESVLDLVVSIPAFAEALLAADAQSSMLLSILPICVAAHSPLTSQLQPGAVDGWRRHLGCRLRAHTNLVTNMAMSLWLRCPGVWRRGYHGY